MGGVSRVRYRIVSVDDHLIEPPDLFEGRMPARLQERAPKVVDLPGGRQAWEYEGNFYPNVGLNAVVGRPREEWSMEPANFDEMRRGCWDIDARIADMDLAGIVASVCFPSLIAGFAGGVFSRSQDCGATWSKPLVVADTNLNQGVNVAVDPTTGEIKTTWEVKR